MFHVLVVINEREEACQMMQVIKDTVQCSRCGCIALPDATKCPKCGKAYHNGNGEQEMLDAVSYLSNSQIEGVNTQQVVRASYQFICPQHGRVNVRAMVISSIIKCPFCP